MDHRMVRFGLPVQLGPKNVKKSLNNSVGDTYLGNIIRLRPIKTWFLCGIVVLQHDVDKVSITTVWVPSGE